MFLPKCWTYAEIHWFESDKKSWRVENTDVTHRNTLEYFKRLKRINSDNSIAK